MQPPIPIGTLLQNRYQVLNTLGQGGFGRTYLAEDKGRFDEWCALKEFIPQQSGSFVLEKSKELFQREASTLYQIRHPQVPQFRATFEQEGRLFLVQDYVEGKTYRDLLAERQAQGRAFSEGEVHKLLEQLLPVLAQIHAQGIIHRDISPDNIMLRQSDSLPVLIDFGVVKEVVTRFRSPEETVPQATTVGKSGYAPKEQMQMGLAYPSSDLYALAVTLLVLLTGREPQNLFDPNSMSWQIPSGINPQLRQIFSRMLSYQPSDRFPHAHEILAALQTPGSGIPAAIGPTQPFPVQAPPPTYPPTPTPNPSEIATMAVGGRPQPLSSRTPTPLPGRAIPPDRASVWDNPWAVLGVGAGVALAAGLGSLALFTAVLDRPTPTTTPTVVVSPTPSPTPSPLLTPTPTPAPVSYEQFLNVLPNRATNVEGELRANETIRYAFNAEEENDFNAYLSGEGVLMSLLGPDGETLGARSQNVSIWEGTLPATGEYRIEVRPVRGIQQANYQLNLNLIPPEPTPEPSPTPVPTQTPTPTPIQVESEQVQFPPGETGVERTGVVGPGRVYRYSVRGQANQVMRIDVLEGNARFNVRFPTGEPIADAAGLLFWETQLPQGGDYLIEVVATEETAFRIAIAIRD